MAKQSTAPVAVPSEGVRPPIRGPALLGRLLLAIGSTSFFALGMVAAEFIARAWAPDYLVETRGLHVFSETYGWAARKGVSATIDGRLVSLNERGHRGRELALPRAGDRARLAVLGDSIAFGLDVSDEEAFPQLLDARDNGIDAANLAVQGYGPGQELLVLRHDGLRSDPDVVVLAFCLANDFADAVLSVSLYDGRTPKPRFRLVGDRLVLDDSSLRQSATQRARQWLSDYSHLFNRMSAVDGRDEGPGDSQWRERKRAALRDESGALRLSLALVREMAAICRDRGITFLVAAFPSRSSYDVKPWLAERFLDSLEAEGVVVVDMAARFRALGLRPAAIQLDEIGHLNPYGHSVASDILEREIARASRGMRSAHADAQERPVEGQRTVTQ